MKIKSLAAIVLAVGALGAYVVEAEAYDWQAAKPQALAYYDAYENFFSNTADNMQVRQKVADVRTIAANIERRETLRKASTKSLLVLREPDAQQRSERAAASDALADLRLYYLYGNMLPRILNEFDDGLVEQGMSRPFPARPLLISEKEFKAKQADLISRIGLPSEEVNK
jgi:hypothetical protein